MSISPAVIGDVRVHAHLDDEPPACVARIASTPQLVIDTAWGGTIRDGRFDGPEHVAPVPGARQTMLDNRAGIAARKRERRQDGGVKWSG